MELFEVIKEFIKPELIVLIPVLYIIGIGFKKTDLIQDKIIPVALGLVSIGLTALYILATTDMSGLKEVFMAVFTALTQGVLIAGASVYANQIYKQLQKQEVLLWLAKEKVREKNRRIIMEELIPGFIPEEDIPVADENTEHHDGEMEEI